MPYYKFENGKVFYEIFGEGEPLLLIHGNSVSSRMFHPIIKRYADNYKVILFDFPGHGKSSRLEKFETDFWYYNSKVANAMLEELNLKNVNVIGTSGGALVGINLALEHPDKVKSLVADSFEGETSLGTFVKTIREDRERDKQIEEAQFFWKDMHGTDWEKVVDMDTNVNIEFAKTGNSFFHKSISELDVPTLLTGSLEDEYCNHLDKIFEGLKDKNSALKIHIFEKGNHPAMFSNHEEFFKIASEFIARKM
ncbi:alpha/beta hydrolase [uncultured Draconibacterium sp.]|uniref:alpha/beta fold hydrolase n=1 Tax=uncultured Draconibacterium sp. TaxID=1573823 RepID=UPI0029C86A2B|nr:alpha/beta hydrolase [uncultured Draconibacterium sp.]